MAFTENPELISVLQEVGVSFDDIFFGKASNAVMSQVIEPATMQRGQAMADQESETKDVPKVVSVNLFEK